MKREANQSNVKVEIIEDILTVKYITEATLRHKIESELTGFEEYKLVNSLIKSINKYLFNDYKQEILILKDELRKLKNKGQ